MRQIDDNPQGNQQLTEARSPTQLGINFFLKLLTE